MSKPLAALCAVMMLAACTEAAPAAPPQYLSIPSAAPPGLARCHAAAKAFNAAQTVEWAHDLENACGDEVDKVEPNACHGWAINALMVGSWAYISRREPDLENPRKFLADARAETVSYAKACDYVMQQPGPNSPSTSG